MKKIYEFVQSNQSISESIKTPAWRKEGESLEKMCTGTKCGDMFTVTPHPRKAKESKSTGLFLSLKLETFRKIKHQTAEVAGQPKSLPHYLYVQIGTHVLGHTNW